MTTSRKRPTPRRMRPNVWLRYDGKWRKAFSTRRRGAVQNLKLVDGTIVKSARVSPIKHGGYRPPRIRNDVVPSKRVGPRPERFQPPQLRVTSVKFVRSNEYGDFAWHAQQPPWDETLFIYNENITNYLSMSTIPGGGNACVRPLRVMGRARGIPTGDFVIGGGFTSLDQAIPTSCLPREVADVTSRDTVTAKEIIDYAITHIVEFLSTEPPDRFTELCYAEHRDGKRDPAGHILVGQGIFRVGEDVILYVTKQLHDVPKRVHALAVKRRRNERSAL